MEWSVTTLAKLFATLALVFAAIVFVPVSDAAACAPEPASLHQAINHNHSSDTSGGDLGACTHGHCHHTAGARHVPSELTLAEPFVQSQHALPLNDGMVSFMTDGLMRPPRN